MEADTIKVRNVILAALLHFCWGPMCNLAKLRRMSDLEKVKSFQLIKLDHYFLVFNPFSKQTVSRALRAWSAANVLIVML